MASTPYGQRRYAPDPPGARDGIALCLSGGGFRAALFHLGALRRLNEFDLLRRLKTITSVSGASTIAAHLANTHHIWWTPGGCSAETWEREISAPFRDFTTRNLSTPSVLWALVHPRSNAGLEMFARACAVLCPAKTVQDLPRETNFIFCATDLVSGEPWHFERSSERRWTVGQAVAISSAFPLIFWRPYRESRPRYLALVDGGVADNRGIEPVWRTHQILLVSDGGNFLRPDWSSSFFYGLLRSSQVITNAMEEMQKRWLITGFMSKTLEGTYWSTSSAVAHYRNDERDRYLGYSEGLARDSIATIRLNYDAFSHAEAAVLENHGYLVADAAIRAHIDVPGIRLNAELRIPHPGMMVDRDAREALRDSARSPRFGRGWLRACVEMYGNGPLPMKRVPTPESVDVRAVPQTI